MIEKNSFKFILIVKIQTNYYIFQMYQILSLIIIVKIIFKIT
jgi:hypothetical protein